MFRFGFEFRPVQNPTIDPELRLTEDGARRKETCWDFLIVIVRLRWFSWEWNRDRDRYRCIRIESGQLVDSTQTAMTDRRRARRAELSYSVLYSVDYSHRGLWPKVSIIRVKLKNYQVKSLQLFAKFHDRLGESVRKLGYVCRIRKCMISKPINERGADRRKLRCTPCNCNTRLGK